MLGPSTGEEEAPLLGDPSGRLLLLSGVLLGILSLLSSPDFPSILNDSDGDDSDGEMEEKVETSLDASGSMVFTLSFLVLGGGETDRGRREGRRRDDDAAAAAAAGDESAVFPPDSWRRSPGR